MNPAHPSATERGKFMRDRRHAVAVAVQQVAGVHPHAADADRHFEFDDLRVAVRADRAAGEARELQRLDLVEVAARARW